MIRTEPAANALTSLEWAAYVRFMREEMEAVSPMAAAFLRQAEETLLREADTGVQTVFVPLAHSGLGH